MSEYPRALVKAVQPLRAYITGRDTDKYTVLCAHPGLEVDHFAIQAQAYSILAKVATLIYFTELTMTLMDM